MYASIETAPTTSTVVSNPWALKSVARPPPATETESLESAWPSNIRYSHPSAVASSTYQQQQPVIGTHQFNYQSPYMYPSQGSAYMPNYNSFYNNQHSSYFNYQQQAAYYNSQVTTTGTATTVTEEQNKKNEDEEETTQQVESSGD